MLSSTLPDLNHILPLSPIAISNGMMEAMDGRRGFFGVKSLVLCQLGQLGRHGIASSPLRVEGQLSGKREVSDSLST